MIAADIMHREPVTVAPQTPVDELARLLMQHAVSGCPVVDAKGALLGVVSEEDFARADSPESGGGPAVAAELMSVPAVTIAPETPVAEVARLFREHGIRRAPVVDRGRLVGIVTRSDLARAGALLG
jgi:CBS domain-containing protein